MQYTETQLTQLIADVEREFNSHLAKFEDASTTLAKSEDGDKKPPFKKPEAKEADAETKPEESAAPEKKPEAAPEAAPEAPAAAPETAPAAPAEATQDHDYDAEDLEHLTKMYMSMSEGERKVHHDAIMKCANMAKADGIVPAAPQDAAGEQAADSHSHPEVQKSELNAHSENAPRPKDKGANIAKDYEEANGGKIDGSEPKNSPGAKSPASKADGVQMEKSEGTEVDLLKSELGTVNAKYDELKKTFDGVAAVLAKMVERKAAPAAKAITSLDVIAKSENTSEEAPLQKEEIHTKLLAKSQDSGTSKADRDLINDFYLNKNVDIKRISHLLK